MPTSTETVDLKPADKQELLEMVGALLPQSQVKKRGTGRPTGRPSKKVLAERARAAAKAAVSVMGTYPVVDSDIEEFTEMSTMKQSVLTREEEVWVRTFCSLLTTNNVISDSTIAQSAKYSDVALREFNRRYPK